MSEVSNCNTASSDKFEKEELIQKFISINSVAVLVLHNLLLFGSPKVSFSAKHAFTSFLNHKFALLAVTIKPSLNVC